MAFGNVGSPAGRRPRRKSEGASREPRVESRESKGEVGGGVRTTLVVPLALAGVTLAIAIADSEAGIATWLRLRSDVARAQQQVDVLVRATEALRGQIDALNDDPFALERAIREDLEFARPGEIIVRSERPPRVAW